MSHLDRTRASRLMAEARIDALLLFQPEAFRYATGLEGGVATMWRRGGACAALVPADAGQASAAVIADHALHFGRPPQSAIELVTHPIWIDYVDFSAPRPEVALTGLKMAYKAQGLGGPRPETFDFKLVCHLIEDLLSDRHLGQARIGVDLEFLPAADFATLQAALPEVLFCDGSDVLRRLRAVKNLREIQALRQANAASEAGLERLARDAVAGMSQSDLGALWEAGARSYARQNGLQITGLRQGLTVGANLLHADPLLGIGDLIKADMGVAVDGYLSDGTRSYALGHIPPGAAAIFAVIERAFAAGAAALRPGARCGDVHSATLREVAAAGLSEYCRGHFGHSIGASCGSEEWPFLSADNDTEILPGMVFAFEVPMYLHGLGAMMIEDQFLITESGATTMNRLPHGLTVLPG